MRLYFLDLLNAIMELSLYGIPQVLFFVSPQVLFPVFLVMYV